MSKRVAIAISGAVSLGSYESGCMFEIIQALEKHNKHADSDEDKILIDVMTGASAGGMTAALLSYGLLYSPASFAHSHTFSGYRAWVKEVSISRLMEEDNTGQSLQQLSLLSTNCVKSIAHDLIIDDPDRKIADANNHRHGAAASKIHLGLAMANLNGIDYKIDTFSFTEAGLGQGEFVQTKFQDQFTRILHATKQSPGSDDVISGFDIAEWSDIIQASVGCGAFPVAFTPVPLAREYANKDSYDYRDKNAEPFASGPFWYMDGGAFNNYPLGMALTLSRREDHSAEDFANRYFIYISPNTRESVASPDFSVDQSLSFSTLAERMVMSIFWQGRFQEWITADSVNQRIDRLDDTAAHLLTVLTPMSSDDLEKTKIIFHQMLETIYAKTGESQNETQLNQYQRLYDAYYSDFSDKEAAALSDSEVALLICWINGICVLEHAGKLNDKEQMKVFTVTSHDNKLASDGLAAFMGFFDQDLREYDYLVGRYNTLLMLKEIHEQQQQNSSDQQINLQINLEEINATVVDVQDALQKLQNKYQKQGKNITQLQMKDLDSKEVHVFYIKIKRLMSSILAEQGLSKVKRTVIWLAVRSRIKASLGVKERWWNSFLA